MVKKIRILVEENKVIIYSAVIALLAIILVLIFIRQEVDRFIFIMPIFAGWILFNILMLPDEEIEPAVSHKKSKKHKRM